MASATSPPRRDTRCPQGTAPEPSSWVRGSSSQQGTAAARPCPGRGSTRRLSSSGPQRPPPPPPRQRAASLAGGGGATSCRRARLPALCGGSHRSRSRNQAWPSGRRPDSSARRGTALGRRARRWDRIRSPGRPWGPLNYLRRRRQPGTALQRRCPPWDSRRRMDRPWAHTAPRRRRVVRQRTASGRGRTARRNGLGGRWLAQTPLRGRSVRASTAGRLGKAGRARRVSCTGPAGTLSPHCWVAMGDCRCR